MTKPLDIIQRPPIRGGLASVAAELPTDDWQRGVEIRETPDDGVFLWEPLCGDQGYLLEALDEGVVLDKPVVGVGEGKRFYPITVGTIVECGPDAQNTVIGDIARQQASGTLDRLIWKALAVAVHGDQFYTMGEYAGVQEEGTTFRTEAVYPSGFVAATPGTIRETLQYLLESVCGCSHSDPIFHVAREFMPHFLGDIVRWDAASEKFFFGPHEVSFDCYPNLDPTGTTGTTEGEQVWITASQRPLVKIEEEDVATVLTRELNRYRVRVERHAIIAFDPTCVYTALAAV